MEYPTREQEKNIVKDRTWERRLFEKPEILKKASHWMRENVYDPSWIGEQVPGSQTWVDDLSRKRKYWWSDQSNKPQINEFDTGIESANPYKRRVYDPKNWEGFGKDLSNWWRGGTRRGVDYIADLGEGIMGIGGLGVDNPFTGKRIGAGEYGDWLFEKGNIEGFGKAGTTLMSNYIPGMGADHTKYRMDIIKAKAEGVQPMIDNWRKARNTIDYKKDNGMTPTKADWTALSDAQRSFDDAGIQSPSGYAGSSGKGEWFEKDVWDGYNESLDKKFAEESDKDYLKEFWGENARFSEPVYDQDTGEWTREIEGMDFGAFKKFDEDLFDYEHPEGTARFDKTDHSRIGADFFGDPVVGFTPEMATFGGIANLMGKGTTLTGSKVLRNVMPSMTKPGLVWPFVQEGLQIGAGGGVATLYEALRDRNVNLYD